MNVIGVVGEFNPFHLGHLEHFNRSRALLGEDAPIVCVMSGDFVQRGGPACFDKHTRARMAILSGADLVFELPLPWCNASAERFALGAVGLLDALGAVTHLSFGSECGEIAALEKLADGAADPDNIERIKARMEGGGPFAAAREAVLRDALGPEAELLQTPNNILGVEYIKALRALGSPMTAMTVRRMGPAHDGFSDGAVRSASQLRAMLAAGESLVPFVPEPVGELITGEMAAGRGPVTMEALEQAVLSRLRLLSQADFCALPDATEGLGNRLYKAVRDGGSLETILAAVKTKRYPMSRLRRMIVFAALGVRAGMDRELPPYARLLASNERGRSLLRRVGEEGSIPIVNKPAAVKTLDGRAMEIFTLTAAARDFYVLGYETADERKGGSDWRSTPVTV